MDEERTGAGTAPEMMESRRPLTKKYAVAILLIAHGVILAAAPYVLRVRLEMSPEAVLLTQVTGYALLAAALWLIFRRPGRDRGRTTRRL